MCSRFCAFLFHPLPADCRAEPNGGSPEHVFDTMVMELDQRLEKVGGGGGGVVTV